MKIAVIGSGVSGLSAAWLLSQNHTVDLYEKDDRLGGHANTQHVAINGEQIAVDTGFIVYNERTYPNLTALYHHLGVDTDATEMSFAVSLANGEHEYSGSGFKGLFAQRANLIRPSFWKMLRDILRFYKEAPKDARSSAYQGITLGSYLQTKNYSQVFCDNHLLPMGAAIWSMPARQLLEFPFKAFIAFCNNHGLLQLKDRPQWRTVNGGSINYVQKLAKSISGNTYLNAGVTGIHRKPGSVTVTTRGGFDETYDHVIFACHSDEALTILNNGSATTPNERVFLNSIRYQRNVAILHSDPALMPKRKETWSAWNYVGTQQKDAQLCVSYWMNALQKLETEQDLFVTLNPVQQPAEGTVLRTFHYAHPVFNNVAVKAQKQIWKMQGHRRTWYCGAYLGYGFHEDGLQSGLAVAEAIGGQDRPWTVEAPNGRIALPENWQDDQRLEAAE